MTQNAKAPRKGFRLTLTPVPMPPDRARSMRMAATGLLVAMAVLFVIALQFQHVHPAWGYVLAFAEAGMVGGMADWFAVTALFRHPMGLPIPHTAIIPTNKDRIADTMAGFLRSNFLVPHVVARRIRQMDVAAAMGRFLVEPRGGEARLRIGTSSLIADALESLDQEKLGGIAKSALKTQLDKLDIAPLLGQLLAAAIADKRHLPLMDSIIRWAAHTLEYNEYLIRDMVHQRANSIFRWIGLDDKLSDAIVEGLYNLLAEMAADEAHPLRHKIEEGLETLAHDLLYDPEMQEKIRRMKSEILANPAMARWMDGLWERGRQALIRAARNPDGAFSGQFGDSLKELGLSLQNNPHMARMINRFARRTLVGVSSRYGDQIVRLVSDTVKRWDAQTITDRVEGAVGRDLQFIRINGTLVGGLVGLVIHAVSQLA